MTNDRWRPALRHLGAFLREGLIEIGLAGLYMDPRLHSEYLAHRAAHQPDREYQEPQGGPVRPALAGPPPGHPERLAGGTPATRAEVLLWRNIQEDL